jgi:hypothetical protein
MRVTTGAKEMRISKWAASMPSRLRTLVGFLA